MIILIFFTKSSTNYLSFVIVVLFILKSQGNKVFYKEIVGSLIVLMMIVIINPTMFDAQLHKIFDLGNMSTSYRYSVVYNDLRVFVLNPLGVGNGNQGYFYNKNIGQVFVSSGSQEIQNVIDGRAGIIGGGPLWPSILSGYGIVGILISVYAIMLLVKRTKSISDPIMRRVLICFCLNFALLGMVASGIHLNINCVFSLCFLFANK